MTTKRLSLALEEETIAEIDSLRGDVPRERWLRRTIEERVAMHHAPVLINAVAVAEPTPSKPLTPRAPASTTRQTTGEPCPHPKKDERQINGGAVLCGLCGARLR